MKNFRPKPLNVTVLLILVVCVWIYLPKNNNPKIEVITNNLNWFEQLTSKTLRILGVDIHNEEFEQIWNYVYKKQYNCTESEYLGGNPVNRDGAYDLCIEERFFPRSKDSSYKCLVYSFGVGGDFSFDDAMAHHGCDVHSFDPSTELEDGFVRDSGVTFHKTGISDEDNDNGFNGWKMRTLKTIIKELGHTGRYLDYLKVDTDKSDLSGFEDVIMAELLTTGLHKCVRQYAMEIHLPTPLFYQERLDRCILLHKQMNQLNTHGWKLYNTTNNIRAALYYDPTFTMRYNKIRFLKGLPAVFLWEVAFVNFDVKGPCNM